MQASTKQLLNEPGLLLSLVDLVQEGLQNSLNGLVRLGLDVSDQLDVELPLVFTKHQLESFRRQTSIKRIHV